MGFYFGSWRQHRPDLVAQAFKSLNAMVQARQLKPLISHRLQLTEFREALDLIRNRKSTGKIVLLRGATF